MLSRILEENKVREIIIAELKVKSHYFPKVYMEQINDITYLSTLVRLKRDNKWYVVHCVQSFINFKNDIAGLAYIRLISEAYNIQHLYIVNGKYEEVDILQIDEVERLTQLIKEQQR